MNRVQRHNIAVTPLEACLLVDYRLGSRTKLKEYIAATQIFALIYEPGSLGLSLPMIAAQHVDTCIFGPSIKAERIKEFILSTQLRGESKLCAFIAFRAKGNRDDISNAHVVLDFPQNQQHFNVGLVRAITASNNGTIPNIERIDPVSGKLLSLSERLSSLDFPPCSSIETSHISTKVKATQLNQPLIEVIATNSAGLFQQLLKLNPLALKFRSDGTPSDYTVQAIRGAIYNSFTTQNETAGIEQFKEILEGLLYQWVKRSATQGRAVADFVLRRELRGLLS
jgi:hypothetical protein